MGALKKRGLMVITAGLMVIMGILPALGAKKTVDQHIQEGREFLKAKKIDKAVISFTEALKLEPTSIPALLNRGNAYCKQASYDNAIADYNEVIRLEPNNGKAYNNRAVAYWFNNEPVKSHEDLKKAESLGVEVNHKIWQEIIGDAETPPNLEQFPSETLTGISPHPLKDKPGSAGEKR